MPSFLIEHIAVKGIAASVPKHIERNEHYPYLNREDINKFIELTGIEERRVASDQICTSDLCKAAAERLIEDLNWDKSEIDILVFISQTPDYILPNTAPLLQERLGLSKACMAFDIPLGCSGYVYGLSVISGMMKAAGLRKGLLLAGDTITKYNSPKDKSAMPLFGDAGSATALQFDTHAPNLQFDLGTDGSGYMAIIIPDGAARNKTTAASLEAKMVEEGIERNNCQLALEGMDVFSFGITTVPKAVNNLIKHFNLDIANVDHFVFHQANGMMNKMIAKKLKLPEEKVPYSLKNFGNTSCATIPLTIVTNLKKQMETKPTSLVLCGFGVGLSWGSVHLQTNKIIITDLLEI